MINRNRNDGEFNNNRAFDPSRTSNGGPGIYPVDQTNSIPQSYQNDSTFTRYNNMQPEFSRDSRNYNAKNIHEINKDINNHSYSPLPRYGMTFENEKQILKQEKAKYK